MIQDQNDIESVSVDIKLLASLIIELNITRRNYRSYPKGHPLIAASLSKVLAVYENLIRNQNEIVLGVTSDSLIVEGKPLEKSNVVFRDFARALFERGIGAILFHKGLTLDELQNFTIILGLKREQIVQHGGIEQVWSKARLNSFGIRPIRYDLLRSSDTTIEHSGITTVPGEGIWERFARMSMHGDISGGSHNDIYLDPEILAEALNSQYALGNCSSPEIQSAFADFLNAARHESEASSSETDQKLAALINNLTPELRRQFLDSTFSAHYQERNDRVLSNLSDNAILETLDDINQNRLSVSPVVFNLLQRLGRNSDFSQTDNNESTSGEDELSLKMKTILREHASEEFIPDNYQKKLNHIISVDSIPRLEVEEVDELLKTLDNRFVENSVGQILMNLIRDGVETIEERELLLQNLGDMFGFFLQTGDYSQLHRMIDQLTDSTFPVEIQYRLRDEYGRRDFLDEILDGLLIWGKPRYSDIRTLILKIGGLFIEAILDRLAEEKNMSLRRFYIDCLIEMGPITRIPIINRLYDKRWYFLRNLLIILSAQEDPSVIPVIQPLLKNEDPRLRHEAVKALLHFHDHLAEKQVLDELDNQNPDLQMAAIQLAEHCTLPAVANKLVIQLSAGGFSQSECDKKSAIIHTLGEIGRAEVLPELGRILSSRSLLHSKQLNKIKADIIQSLPKYPVAVSRPVLERIAGGSGDHARLAQQAIQQLSSGNQA